MREVLDALSDKLIRIHCHYTLVPFLMSLSSHHIVFISYDGKISTTHFSLFVYFNVNRVGGGEEEGKGLVKSV